jgi:hypothetical protein
MLVDATRSPAAFAEARESTNRLLRQFEALRLTLSWREDMDSFLPDVRARFEAMMASPARSSFLEQEVSPPPRAPMSVVRFMWKWRPDLEVLMKNPSELSLD